MKVLNLVDFLFSNIMVIEFIPKHGVLFQVTSKTLIVASLDPRSDM